MEQSNLFIDGWRYGVRFHDGSVMDRWSGVTQREKAEHFALVWAQEFAPDNIRPVRRRVGFSEWETYPLDSP